MDELSPDARDICQEHDKDVGHVLGKSRSHSFGAHH